MSVEKMEPTDYLLLVVPARCSYPMCGSNLKTVQLLCRILTTLLLPQNKTQEADEETKKKHK